MEISVRQIKDMSIFDIDGDVNEADSYAKIKECTNSSVKNKCRKVAVNLSHVTFVNSSGLGLLVQWHNKLKEVGGELFITEPPQNICEILKLLNIDKIITIYSLESSLIEKLK